MLKEYINENKNDIIFYRNSYRRYIYVAIALLGVNYFLIGLLYWKLMTIEVPPNFATTSDGRLITLIAE